MAALMMLCFNFTVGNGTTKLTAYQCPFLHQKISHHFQQAVESITVQITPTGAYLTAEVRATDARATTGDTETKQWIGQTPKTLSQHFAV